MEKPFNEVQLAAKAKPIIKAIDERLVQYQAKHFYIGKVGNEEKYNDRYATHSNEGYTFMWELAKGTPEQIAQMEDYLIRYYKAHQKDRIDNDNEGSAGPDGGILYVCILEGKDLMHEELFDDTSEIATGFPLDFQKD